MDSRGTRGRRTRPARPLSLFHSPSRGREPLNLRVLSEMHCTNTVRHSTAQYDTKWSPTSVLTGPD